MKARRCLYVSYFGLREPLVHRQVLPYLSELGKDMAGVSLLTFEPVAPGRWQDGRRAALQADLSARGVAWSHLRYHKRPSLPATLFDILQGALFIARFARRRGIGVVHCRGHVPMAMGMLAKRLCRVQLIFDIRGFMPEEYVDAGVWPPNGFLYRLSKRVEKRLFDSADAFVVLTERARRHLSSEGPRPLAGQKPVAVIPCCVDLKDFATPDPASVSRARRALGLEGRTVYVYSGQLGGWYLDDALVAFLARARVRQPSSFALILTTSPASELSRKLAAAGFAQESFQVRAVAPDAVPQYLAAGDVGLSLIKPCFSKISSSPTKVGEYLAAGLFVVSTADIGDVDELLQANNVGFVLRGLDDAAYDEALSRSEVALAEPGLKKRLRDVARQKLDLESVGGPLYRQLYAQLACREPSTE